MHKLTRKEQKESTRAGLLQQAESLFALNGISATSTADIAKSLQVSHGTLFMHFATREELTLAVVEKFGNRLNLELGRRCETDMTLKQLLKAHIDVLAEFEDFYLRLISESQSLPVQVRSILYAMNTSLSYRFYRSAKPLMKSGEIKKMDQPVFFNLWLGTLHYQIMNRDLFSEKFPVMQYKGDELLRHFLFLIKTNNSIKGENK